MVDMRQRVGSLSVVALALIMAVASLVLGGSQQVIAQDEEAEANALMRFVHASPDAPAIDVVVDGDVVAAGLEFGAVTDLAPVEPGERTVQLVPAGEPVSAALVEEQIDTEADQVYTVAAANLLNALDIRTVQSNLDDLPDGESRVRLVNLSPEADEVDLFQVGGDQWFDNVPFGEASEHRNVEAGNYDLDLRLNDSEVSLLGLTGLVVEAGNEVTLMVIGTQSDDSLSFVPLMVSVDTPCAEQLGIGEGVEDACVRVIHGAVDAPAVDVYIEDGLVAENLMAESATEFFPVPSGDGRSVKLVPTGGSIDDPLVESEVDLQDRTATEIVIGGAVDDLKVINSDVDLSSLSPEQSRLRVVHLSPDAGDVDISAGDDNMLFEGVGFESSSDWIVVDSGEVELEVTGGEDDEVIYRSEPLTLEPGMVYSLVAGGSVESGTFTLQVVSAPAQIQSDEAAATAVDATPGAETGESETLDETTPTPLAEESTPTT